jgi:hypothetical protein
MTTEHSDIASVAPINELAARARRIRTRKGGGQVDRWHILVGAGSAGLGLLAIFIGWLGASHTVLVFEQVPYLISGGLIGLALVIVGAFIYYAYWQTLLVRDTRTQIEQNRDVIESLQRIEVLLCESRPVPAAAPTRKARGSAR